MDAGPSFPARPNLPTSQPLRFPAFLTRGGKEGVQVLGTKGLRLFINGRMEDAVHGYWPNRKGTLTLPCVGVIPHPAFCQACSRLPPLLAWTFTLTNEGSIELALGSNSRIVIYNRKELINVSKCQEDAIPAADGCRAVLLGQLTVVVHINCER